ncbi:MAG: alpha/beta hydrolase [Proteobacteria bacterium]|nr:alpha/beta hydrolase [Pseudomonadota bacterium]
MKMTKCDFKSNGVRCDGDLYLPASVSKPPVVIMAHGLAAQKNFRIPAYAERFVEKNMAAFLFDYRTFGQSDGTPRHIVDPFQHLKDWEAAIRHMRSCPEVDGSRVALWGSSFSGGHVIATAAKDDRISAVVSQVPFASGFSSIQMKSLKDIVLSSVYGVYDGLRKVLSLSPHYSPVIAYPGTFAAMNTEESYKGYLSIMDEDTTWENKLASRVFLTLPLYSPRRCASRVKAPTLVMAGKQDSIIPFKAVEKMAGRLPKGELVVMDCNHFDPYTGDMFERFVEKQADFLEKHLA